MNTKKRETGQFWVAQIKTVTPVCVKAELQETQEILRCHQQETRNYLKQYNTRNIILVLKIDVG